MRRALAAAGLMVLWAMTARAQLAPNANWRTIATPHFRVVHFTPELEAEARRTAANAPRSRTRSYRASSRRRAGVIDVVLSDDVDFTNGYATQFSHQSDRALRQPAGE